MRLAILGVASLALLSTGQTRPPPAPTGTITGNVKLVMNGNPISIDKNVWVYVEHETPQPMDIGKGKKFTIKQQGQKFNPLIVVIPTGATVEFPNLDKNKHSVFSPRKDQWPGFDLARFDQGAPDKERTFKVAGEYDIYCDMHPKMAATVKVVPTMYSAQVDESGNYTLAVPPGNYWVWAWTPGDAKSRSTGKIAVGAGATVPVAALNVQAKPLPTTHLDKNGNPYKYP